MSAWKMKTAKHSLEIDTQKRWISIDAPMAKALLGKEVGDEITVLTPNGETFCTVTAIRYAGA